MKRLWQRYADRVDALSLRERIWVFGAAVLLVGVIAHELFLDPEFSRSKQLSTSLLQKQAESRALLSQVTVLLQAKQRDPDADSREQIAKLRAKLDDINARIAAEERKFTAPAQMQIVLQELLARNRSVSLVDLRTLPTSSLAELRGDEAGVPKLAAAEPGAAADAARLVFRHGVELKVTGTYLDLLAYLGDLERLPTQLYWGALDLEVSEHPRVTMKLTVYTLSLDRAWMSV